MAGDVGGASAGEGEGRVEEDEALHIGEHIAENRARLHEFTREMLSK